MAIAFDTASGGHTATTTSLTWSHTCTGVNRILFVGWRTGGTVTSVTYNSVAMTVITQDLGVAKVGLAYLINPASGSNTVAINQNNAFIAGISSSYNGVKQTSQPDSSNTRNVSGTNSGNISTTIVAANCWTIAVAKASSSAITGGVNATVRATGDNNEHAILDSNGPLQPGSNTMNFTSAANAEWNEIIASFAPFVEPQGGSTAYFM